MFFEEDPLAARSPDIADPQTPVPGGDSRELPQVSLGGSWDGILHEFRNHLTLLMAGTTGLRSTLPGALAADCAEALQDMETSVHVLESLLALVDAGLRPGRSAASDVGKAVQKAITLAAPSLRGWVMVEAEGRGQVPPRFGNVIEAALGALLAELGRSSELRSERPQPSLAPIRILASADSGVFRAQLAGPGSQPPLTWRTRLATYLLEGLGGRIEPVAPSGWAISLKLSVSKPEPPSQ